MKAIVTGMIATYPVGGVVWDYGQYALGLQRLGFDVTYLEDTGAHTYDPNERLYGEDPSYGVEYLSTALSQLSPKLGKNWHFRCRDGRRFGLAEVELKQRLADADLFLNVSGGCLLRDDYASCRSKVLIDTDPGFNQFVNYPRADRKPGWQGSRSFREHDHFFTYAERFGREGCAIPGLGLKWQVTRPPVLTDLWRPDGSSESWTTVMTWDNFRRPIEHEGHVYGSKEVEFRHVEALAERLPRLEVAVGGKAPVELWRQRGWSVIDSHKPSLTADSYRDYIQRSGGELSVAKNVYVATRSGWFSCRSVCYLAAGRPVVLQDTGFSDVVPTGEGLLSFDDEAGAFDAIGRVEADRFQPCTCGARARVRAVRRRAGSRRPSRACRFRVVWRQPWRPKSAAGSVIRMLRSVSSSTDTRRESHRTTCSEGASCAPRASPTAAPIRQSAQRSDRSDRPANGAERATHCASTLGAQAPD